MKLIRKPESRDGVYLITPAEAQAHLEHGCKNRPLQDFRAETIAMDIRARRWRINGETMVFNAEGRLLDGQHRLRACVLANEPISSYCIFGIDDNVFASFNQGKSRGGSDLSALMGFEHYSTVAAMARLAIYYEDESIMKTGAIRRLSQEVLKQYLKRHASDIVQSVARVVQAKGGIVKLIPLSQACFLYYETRSDHPTESEDFLEKLSTGTALRKGDALLLFRNRMQELQGSKHRLSQTEKLALLIKTWNAFLTGRTVGALKWNSHVEAFPRIQTKTKANA